MNKLRSFNQAVMGARIQPAKLRPSSSPANRRAPDIWFRVVILQLAAFRRLDVLRHLHHIVVVEVEPGHRPVRISASAVSDGQRPSCRRTPPRAAPDPAPDNQTPWHRKFAAASSFTEALAKVDISGTVAQARCR